MTSLLYTIQEELLKNKNAERAKGSMRFFKTGPGQYGEGDQFIGLTVPEVRAIVKKFKTLPVEDIVALLHNPYHEYRLTALLILVWQYEHAQPLQQKELYMLYMSERAYINNWDLIDLTAPHIPGHYLYHNDNKAPILYEFAISPIVWDRRIAMLSTFTFLRNNSFMHTKKIAYILNNDKHDLIHKATGWMLREMGKKNEQELLQYLDLHAWEMPRTALRYAIERLPAPQQRAYRQQERPVHT